MLTTPVTLPLWVLLLAGLLAVMSLLFHILLPSARWFFRRKANRVIDEVNQRLALQLPVFKLTRREVLIDRLMFHPDVLAAIDTRVREQGEAHTQVLERVRSYATEIVPAFNAWLYFRCAYWLARQIVRALYRVRLGFADDEALARVPPDSSVVFVMNHRSNMDYVIATYLAADRTALSYAVGEWARVWPLRQLIRSMGGFFVRRASGDPLYRQVLACYVQMAAENGVPQAVFPEGRLSRDGKLGPPRLGLLGYLTRSFNTENARDIVFIPVAINYDRVLEDRTLLRSLDQQAPRRSRRFVLKTLLQFIGRNLWKRLRGKWFRYGYACVNFGTPLSLHEWARQQPSSTDPGVAAHHEALPGQQHRREASQVEASNHQMTEALGDELMRRIGEIIPILPVALVATVWRHLPRQRCSELELKRHVARLIDVLERRGHHVYIPRGDRDYALSVGLRMLALRHVLQLQDGLYRINPDERALLDYYAASIEHLFDADDTHFELNDYAAAAD